MGANVRRGVWAAVGLAGVVTLCGAGQSYVSSGEPVAAAGSSLVTHVIAQEGRPHTLVVVDPHSRALAVYHVEAATGKLALKSVRNATWDLQVSHFSTEDPLPQDIRSAKLAQ